jgi:HSP20 family protein
LFDFGRKDPDTTRSRIGKYYPTSREDRSDQEWFRSGLGNMVRMFGDDLPREFDRLVRDTMGPKGDVRQSGDPFVYGFSYSFNPAESEPIFREFGNIRASDRELIRSNSRTPLVDIVDRADAYNIAVELPGVKKEDINLNISEDEIEVRTTGEKTFFTRNILADPVDPGTAKASCNNGVLKIEVEKQRTSARRGTEVKID